MKTHALKENGRKKKDPNKNTVLDFIPTILSGFLGYFNQALTRV